MWAIEAVWIIFVESIKAVYVKPRGKIIWYIFGVALWVLTFTTSGFLPLLFLILAVAWLIPTSYFFLHFGEVYQVLDFLRHKRKR